MSNWNTDMSSAPKGKPVTIKGVNGLGIPFSWEKIETEPVILMSGCRKVIKSYWLPKENRWAGFSEKSRPLAWQAWPEWDEGVAAHALEIRDVHLPDRPHSGAPA